MAGALLSLQMDQYLYESGGASVADSSRIYYTRTAGPTAEPITLDDAVRHLQLAVGDDNSYVQSLIQVARDVTEGQTGRALMSSTWLAATGEWPRCDLLALSVAPLTAVTAVRYYAEGATTLTTLSASEYVVATAVTPAVIVFGETFTRPALAMRPDAVQITFTAGEANPSLVDPSLKHALRILVRHYYDHPEAVGEKSFTDLPYNLQHLLLSNRVSGWVA